MCKPIPKPRAHREHHASAATRRYGEGEYKRLTQKINAQEGFKLRVAKGEKKAAKMPAPLEAEEQAALFEWADVMMPLMPELEMMAHIPNGGSRHPAEAANLKRQGVKAGYPDIFLAVPRQGYHGLYIEMKRIGEKARPNQLKWHENLKRYGYSVHVCYVWDEARRVLERYLK